MYTPEMKRAFHNVVKPPQLAGRFGLKIAHHKPSPNTFFLEVIMPVEQLINLPHDDKITALQYTLEVKKALEGAGAVVLVTREEAKP